MDSVTKRTLLKTTLGMAALARIRGRDAKNVSTAADSATRTLPVLRLTHR